jgi:hypothetical protein
MLKSTSKTFRNQFILEFTKELIRNSKTYRDIKISKEVKLIVHHKTKGPVLVPRGEIKEIIKDKIQRDSEKVSILKQEEDVLGNIQKPLPPRRPLRIPDARLPQTVSHYRPSPTREGINLGKLTSLIKDPLVKVVEVNGEGEKVIVMGRMGRKTTSISLNKEQIDEIITNFSQASKIPVEEGVFKVVHGNLVLSAMVSDVISSKFIITKMASGPRH